MPYIGGDRFPTTLPRSPTNENRTQAREEPSTEGRHLAPAISPPYDQKLSPTNFRLMRLDAVGDPDAPIYCELEMYEFGDCPEYEAVSYCWGGEDNDNQQRFPVFVGRYWDVLLQTKNCVDMLRHLRPRRGFRRVWADAICINQKDDIERGKQVACMSTIFRGCSRVVGFLGSDIIQSVPEGKHPLRLNRDELFTLYGNSLDQFRQLLQRRYFSRV